MAVTLTGGGGIFTKLGHMAAGGADQLAVLGGTATSRVLSGASWQTRGVQLGTDFAATPVMSDVLDGLWSTISAYRSAQLTLLTSLKSLAEKALVRQVDLDANLPAKDLTSALAELIRQMRASADSLNASTVAAGAQAAQGTPTGTPVFVLSLKRPDGLIWQTPFAETLRFTCSGDSQSGGATARQESFGVRGAAAAPDALSYLWPAGSGASATLTLADAQLDNAGNNLLTNGDFETFTTANYPDNWVTTVGVAGTNVFAAGSSDSYTQTNALKITGDVGGTLVALTQELNKAASTTAGGGGTPGKVTGQQQLAVNCWVKCSATPTAGVLELALVDGAGTVINDDSGTANLFTRTLTTVSTTYLAVSGTFRLPTVLPATVKLRLRTSTAIDNTKSVYVDDLALAPMTSLYNGGPSAAGFAGVTKPVKGDVWTAAVTNTMGVLAAWMERLFALRDKQLIFPYSGSPTVADSVVA